MMKTWLLTPELKRQVREWLANCRTEPGAFENQIEYPRKVAWLIVQVECTWEECYRPATYWNPPEYWNDYYELIDFRMWVEWWHPRWKRWYKYPTEKAFADEMYKLMEVPPW